MIISAIDRSPMPERESLLAALQSEYGVEAVALVIPQTPGVSEFDLNIHPEGESPFTVARTRTGSVMSDGTWSQNAAVAALVRALLPAEHARVVAFDPEGGVFVDLVAGITPEQVSSGWRDISEGGF